MPRARNIKPGFFENEHLGVLDGDTRLLFASLWTLADREGVVECRVPKIRTYCFRYRTDITDDIVNRYLTVLARLDSGKMLKRVVYQNEEYLLIQNFEKHASPHHTEKKGDYPDRAVLECAEMAASSSLTVRSRLSNARACVKIPLIPDSLIPDSLIPDSLIPESGCTFQKNVAPKPEVNRTSLTEDFELSEEWLQFAVKERSVRPDIVRDWFSAFKEHYLRESKTKKGKKSDWFMTWKNWVRREHVPYDLRDNAVAVQQVDYSELEKKYGGK